MTILYEFLRFLSEIMRPHVRGIAFAVMAALLVVFGADFNRMVRRLVKRYPFAVRVLAFVLVCAFGYGMLVLFMARLLGRVLASTGDLALAPVVMLIFLVVGWLAERRHQI